MNYFHPHKIIIITKFTYVESRYWAIMTTQHGAHQPQPVGLLT